MTMKLLLYYVLYYLNFLANSVVKFSNNAVFLQLLPEILIGHQTL